MGSEQWRESIDYDITLQQWWRRGNEMKNTWDACGIVTRAGGAQQVI